MTATEYVVLVDQQDREIGVAPKLYAHEQGLLHRAFSIFIFTKKPTLKLLLQKRAYTKYHSPGLWTNTCCSHPRPQETTLLAAERRLTEEMGLTLNLLPAEAFIYKAHFENGLIEHEYDHVFIGFMNEETSVACNDNEVADHQWIALSALQTWLTNSPEEFTPWFKQALALALTHVS